MKSQSNNGFIVYLLNQQFAATGRRHSFVVLVDHAMPPTARAEGMLDVTVVPELRIAANEASA